MGVRTLVTLTPRAFRRSLAVILATIAAITGDLDRAFSQSFVTGTIVDSGSGAAVTVADVEMRNTAGEVSGSAVSDDMGRFRVRLAENGLFTVTVRRIGYIETTADSIAVAEGDEVELQIRMGSALVPLDPVTVVATRRFEPERLVQFRERAARNQRTGRGRVYTREQIDEINPWTAQQLLQGVIWGPRCRPVILFDNLPVDDPRAIRGSDLEGVEIYHSANQIPPEFYRPDMCGLALLWSRADDPGMRPFSWRRAAIAGALVAVIGFFVR